jgi:hypothetical protein
VLFPLYTALFLYPSVKKQFRLLVAKSEIKREEAAG